MRRQLVHTVSALLEQDERVVLLLGDIGVFGFREAFAKYPARVYNIGILEQATVSLAAGLAKTGLIPIVHSIAPFITERCLEQIKVDFGYQGLGGTFVSVGASYDYAALGCTHHCPADVQVMGSIPGMEVIVPGAPAEFDALLRERYASQGPTYIRLSEHANRQSIGSGFGKAEIVRKGDDATVVAIGPILDTVLAACDGLDVTVLYYTTVVPFDRETLRANAASGRILLCEPYYRGALANEIAEAMWPDAIRLLTVGVPHRFLHGYGTAAQHDEAIGLTAPALRTQLERLIDA